MEIEPLRSKYKPSKIKVLFIGESAPAGGAFFYAANSNLFRAMKQALSTRLGAAPDFLSAFMKAGCYLDDLVLTPVNWHDNAERKRLHRENIPALARRLSQYHPEAIVAVMKAISGPVKEACRQAELTCPFYCVSFPANGRQSDFRREMTDLIPRLPIA
ncbi:MAG TPA: hypothetical protein VM891_06155 [Amaricoccus sp.]|nr:hypothetical protein [Amaricoccus sp.]